MPDSVASGTRCTMPVSCALYPPMQKPTDGPNHLRGFLPIMCNGLTHLIFIRNMNMALNINKYLTV